MNILDFYKMNNVVNKYFGSSLPESKMVVPRCLKLIWNHWWIISGTYFSPFQGSITYTGASGGLRSHILASFGNFWIIFLIFLEWIILFNIADSIEWILFWMNIQDFVLNWIIFRPNSMKKLIFKTDRQPLSLDDLLALWKLTRRLMGGITSTSKNKFNKRDLPEIIWGSINLLWLCENWRGASWAELHSS